MPKRSEEVAMRIRVAAIGIALVAFYTAAASLTAAADSQLYLGGNKSYSQANNTQIVICDGEADGDTAYAKGNAGSGANYRVDDLDGSSGYCYYKSISSAVKDHRTCEVWNNRPDLCSVVHKHF